MEPDLSPAIQPLVSVLDKLGIAYFISGSVASSVYGTARATMDIDLVADIKLKHVPQLKSDLESLYYVDENMIREAIQRRASFNLIHLDTMLKVDIFLPKNRSYSQEALARRKKDTLGKDEPQFYFSSPEDVVLSKLVWFKEGGGVSERQWLDTLGILKVQDEKLDKKYLFHWAAHLKVPNLLVKAFSEAGIDRSS